MSAFTRFYSEKKWWHASELLKGTLYYSHKKIDLLTNEETSFTVEELNHELNQFCLNEKRSHPHIWHFFYEFGFYSMDLPHLVEEQSPLAIHLEYQKVEELTTLKLPHHPLKLEVIEDIDFKTYDEAFQKGHEHLLRGDCYQYNLTYRNRYKIHGLNHVTDLWENLAREREGTGEYAHFSYLPQLNKCFISNSPECLFDIENQSDFLKIETRPIKGTRSLGEGEAIEKVWEELKSSEKDQAELYMIIDLLRNDMYRIEERPIEIKELKKQLLVPGIVHQMGVLEGELSHTVTLGQVMKAMFPGGSITGAPKKRVMEILKQIENTPRGFYCGSTVISWKNSIKSSINIRSAQMALSELVIDVHAGGGITLLSSNQQEFLERQAKIDSFLVRIQ